MRVFTGPYRVPPCVVIVGCNLVKSLSARQSNEPNGRTDGPSRNAGVHPSAKPTSSVHRDPCIDGLLTWHPGHAESQAACTNASYQHGDDYYDEQRTDRIHYYTVQTKWMNRDDGQCATIFAAHACRSVTEDVIPTADSPGRSNAPCVVMVYYYLLFKSSIHSNIKYYDEQKVYKFKVWELKQYYIIIDRNPQ